MTTRQAYVDKLKAGLDELNAELDKIEARARGLEADARSGYEKKLTELRRQRDELGAKIDQIKNAGSDSWEALKEGAEGALSQLVSGVSEAKDRLEPVLTRS